MYGVSVPSLLARTSGLSTYTSFSCLYVCLLLFAWCLAPSSPSILVVPSSLPLIARFLNVYCYSTSIHAQSELGGTQHLYMGGPVTKCTSSSFSKSCLYGYVMR
eukprot:TRINITY_DN230_c0_g2_i1.p3 TRINITY_DN230_c0_g2~~TRINITY_DN230_c0_g2_i1.p3  ORF type:complete len:104 (+),score=12.50 TRINITY_DN230_c0_g2_i1:1351-1662(+)